MVTYPTVRSTDGGLPSVTSWRQWGHSWASGGFDDQIGPEANRTRMSERIAGMMHLSPHAVQNEAIFGSQAMGSPNGYGRVLQRIVPHSTYQNWPWEPHRFGLEAFLWGVNDIGGVTNSGNLWSGQGAMYNIVWKNTWRSIIQRCIAGAIYGSITSAGVGPLVWRKNISGVMVSDPSFIGKGPGGVGAGHWQFKQDVVNATGYGYWWTDQVGDVIDITVPIDFDTGTIAIRHLCPGSWFSGPALYANPLTGVTTASSVTAGAWAEQPAPLIQTGAANPRSPSAVTVIGGSINNTVDCQGLASRLAFTGTGVNPGPGVIGPHGAMTHVSRHALTPTPGTKQTIRLTVGGLPSGGWYGFDSWEIEAPIETRPIVQIANVADPADWSTLYNFSGPVWSLATRRAQEFSNIISNICFEYVDPGIMVADIRSKIATAPIQYAELLDSTAGTTNRPLGVVIPLSSYSTVEGSGDGTHPHALGERLIVEAYMNALANANLPRGRGAIPFAPGRELSRDRVG